MAKLYIAQYKGHFEGNEWKMDNKADTGETEGLFISPTGKDQTLHVGNAAGATEATKAITIYQFGVQTLPGVKMVINDNATEFGHVIVGQTGIFELNLSDATPILSVQFPRLNTYLTQASPDMNYILIDLVYAKEESASEEEDNSSDSENSNNEEVIES